MATKKHSAHPSAVRARTRAVPDLASVDFDAALTTEEVSRSEVKYNETWGVSRRMVLMTLTRSRAELIEGFFDTEEGIETALSLMDDIDSWRKHLEGYIELANAAKARMIIAGTAAVEADHA